MLKLRRLALQTEPSWFEQQRVVSPYTAGYCTFQSLGDVEVRMPPALGIGFENNSPPRPLPGEGHRKVWAQLEVRVAEPRLIGILNNMREGVIDPTLMLPG